MAYPIVKDVQVGATVNSQKNGKGLVTKKTARTITVTFERVVVKNTYPNDKCYFWESDF